MAEGAGPPLASGGQRRGRAWATAQEDSSHLGPWALRIREREKDVLSPHLVKHSRGCLVLSRGGTPKPLCQLWTSPVTGCGPQRTSQRALVCLEAPGVPNLKQGSGAPPLPHKVPGGTEGHPGRTTVTVTGILLSVRPRGAPGL